MTTSRTMTLFIPSKGRPHEALAAISSCYRSGFGFGDNAAVAVVDNFDDERTYIDAGISAPDVAVVRSPGVPGFVKPMNEIALMEVKFPDIPKYIGFMGDDHRVRSEGPWWNLVLDRDEAFVYGDDKFQGENLPTAVFIRSDVVRSLGYFAPPVLQHLYADNAWLELGRAADSIHYEPRLVIEHMHPAAGKGVYDELKAELNDSPMKTRDERAFNEWRYSPQFNQDVEKVKECLRAS